MGERLGRDFQKSFIGTKEWETDRQPLKAINFAGSKRRKYFWERESKKQNREISKQYSNHEEDCQSPN